MSIALFTIFVGIDPLGLSFWEISRSYLDHYYNVGEK